MSFAGSDLQMVGMIALPLPEVSALPPPPTPSALGWKSESAYFRLLFSEHEHLVDRTPSKTSQTLKDTFYIMPLI